MPLRVQYNISPGLMKPRFFCVFCSTEVFADDERCPKCGRLFTAARCPQCGYEGRPDDFDKGCPDCGYMAVRRARGAEARAGAREPARASAPARSGVGDRHRPVFSAGAYRLAAGLLLLALGILLVLLLVR